VLREQFSNTSNTFRDREERNARNTTHADMPQLPQSRTMMRFVHVEIESMRRYGGEPCALHSSM
jgi:hypothetical protein